MTEDLKTSLQIQATVLEYKRQTINDNLEKHGYSIFYRTGLLEQTFQYLLRELKEAGYSVGVNYVNTLEFRVDVAGCESTRTYNYE